MEFYGYPLEKLGDSIKKGSDWWLDSQATVLNVDKAIDSVAQDVPVRLKVKTDHRQGHRVSRNKASIVNDLLEQENSH